MMDSKKAWVTKIRENRHIGDFRRWENSEAYQKALERLLQDLSARD